MRLAALARNPLLLTMIANVHYYRGALPGSRAELYNEVCEVFLGKRLAARGIKVELSAAQRRLVLQYFAMQLMRARLRSVDAPTAEQHIAVPLKSVSLDMTPAHFLRIIENTSGILLEAEPGRYSFAHLTFQEYLAAGYVAENPASFVLADVVDDPWWRETIRLYAAQADATEIVLACVQSARSNIAMLTMAMDCLLEGKSIQPRARLALESLARSDGPVQQTDRAFVGAARLIRRRKDLAGRLGPCSVFGPVITNLEYQSFLESGNRQHTPGHWTSDGYPGGQDHEPVTGLRLSDARAFCKWLHNLIGDEATYRLPMVWEFGKHGAFDEESVINEKVSSFWSEAPVEQEYNSRNLRLLISSADPGRSLGSVVGTPGFTVPAASVEKLVRRDFAGLRQPPGAEQEALNWAFLNRFDSLTERYRTWDQIDPTSSIGRLSAAIAENDDTGDEYFVKPIQALLQRWSNAGAARPEIESELRVWLLSFLSHRVRRAVRRRGPVRIQLDQTIRPAETIESVAAQPRVMPGSPDAIWNVDLNVVLIESALRTRIRLWLGRPRRGPRVRNVVRVEKVNTPVPAQRQRRTAKVVALPSVTLRTTSDPAPVPAPAPASLTLQLEAVYDQLVLAETLRRGHGPAGGALVVVRQDSPTPEGVRIRDRTGSRNWVVPVLDDRESHLLPPPRWHASGDHVAGSSRRHSGQLPARPLRAAGGGARVTFRERA